VKPLRYRLVVFRWVPDLVEPLRYEMVDVSRRRGLATTNA
jgi:hypothetical protein